MRKSYFALILSSSITQAVVGPALIQGGAPWVCRVSFSEKSSQNVLGICSSALTSSGQVTLAAHCLDLFDPKHQQIEIACGETGNQEFAEVFRPTKIWVDPDYSAKFFINDLARINLDRPSRIEPVAFISEAEEQRLEAGQGQCQVAGFGFAADGKLGKLHTTNIESTQLIYNPSASRPLLGYWVLATESLSWPETQEALLTVYQSDNITFPQSQNSFASIRPGDSGGPLYCRLSPTSPWKLMGIASIGEINFTIWGAEFFQTWQAVNSTTTKVE